MNLAIERARSSWLMAFGDVVTLLITFFIVVIVMNKGEISKIQKWVDRQVTESYEILNAEVENQGLKVVQVEREARGILLKIQSDQAFESGSFTPTETLVNELQQVSTILPKIPLFQITSNPASLAVIQRAQQDGMQWYAGISVEGHTDNDWVDPQSRLRNNFFLSTLRAEAVMNVLYQQSGLPAERFSISGYGEWQPIADNKNPGGKNLNRRVEVLISANFQLANGMVDY